MARLQKPTLVHAMNGNPSRKHLPTVEMAGADMPVGAPPKGMPRDEVAAWGELVTNMPWLNRTHRGHLELAVKAMVRFRRLDRFFAGRRAVVKKRGLSEVYAELNDEGTRSHPAMASYRDARDSYRSTMAELGASPSSQARLLGFIEESIRRSKKAAKAAEESFLT